MFIIEDEWHAETQNGEFATRQDAIAELERRATIPWDEEPNQAPCVNWRTCGRKYVLIEYDDSQTPWRELSRLDALEVSAAELKWLISSPT